MMPTMIAARSLSSLNDLANAPPPNPPLQLQDEEPLILYIARVPGSRDVFLTPMKPKDKVVNAQDIQSSLYYCHISSDQDDVLLQDELRHRQTLDSDLINEDFRETKQARDSVQTRTASGQLAPLPQSSIPSNNELHSRVERTIRRKPINNHNSSEPIKVSPGQTRKILGPRPIVNRSTSSPTYRVSEQANGSSSTGASDSRLSASHMLLKPEKDNSQTDASELFSAYTNIALRNRYITLIRRDPATDNQWNIGQLSLLQPRSPDSPNRSPRRRKKDILIELSAPGYTKFSDKVDEPGFTRQLNFSHIPNSRASFQATSPTSPIASSSQPTFLTPWQTSCVMQTAVTGGAVKCYHSLPDPQIRPPIELSYRDRPHIALVSELRFNLPKIIEKSTMKKKENRRPVSFQASGHGRYSSFSRDTDLPNITSGMSISNNHVQEAVQGPLPRSALLQPLSGSPPTLPLRHGRFRLPSFHHRAHSDEADLKRDAHHSYIIDNPDIDTPLDLSLGQERAGGGFNGNKAKLGKLIIYGGQGLAMLDLLVAANMSIWFQDTLEY